MDKNTLNKAVESFQEKTRIALQTFYDELNPGQRKKVLKNEEIKELCDQYGVITSEVT